MKIKNINFETYLKDYPDESGYFGKYKGVFISELRRIRKEFQGRPTPISHLERLSNKLGNVQIYVKREDLYHTGAHKLNHCMGEALLSKYMGKKKRFNSCKPFRKRR